MNSARVLDCTLRDGGYLVDKFFGEKNIKAIVQGLVDAKIDYIEIGFFQNEGFGEGKTVYFNSQDVKKYIPKNKKQSEFLVLADYSRYDIKNLDKRQKDSIDGFRQCFFKEERFKALDNCWKIKENGYKLFIQPVDLPGYTDEELLDFIKEINKITPFCLYMVDTFGSMFQEDLHHYFEVISHNLIPECAMGYHSHNNMQMSAALAQEFIRMAFGKRETIVDGAICGMGRGAGNAPTELIVQYLISKHKYDYNIESIFEVIDNIIPELQKRCKWGYKTEFLVSGNLESHVNNVNYLMDKGNLKVADIKNILSGIDKDIRKRYDYDLLDRVYLEYMKRKKN